MGVKASLAGIRAMGEVIDARDLKYQDYAMMSMAIGLTGRRIGHFVKGGEVKKINALAIINYLKLKRENIVPDVEWHQGAADESVSLDELWEDLFKLAKHAPLRLKMVPAVDDMTAAFNDDGKEKYLTELVAKSKVWIDLDVRQSGYLVLLDVDSTGEITCLSPSEYVPEYRVRPGIERLPQAETSAKRVFQPATLGEETLLAAIFPTEPDFAWLTVGEECHQLDAAQLGELIRYVKASKKPVDLIRSSVMIVAA
jgi:Domain of unknown function (DUF4384)